MTDEELILRRPANPRLFTEFPQGTSARALTEAYLAAFGLPWAGVEELDDPGVPTAVLASPDAWQEWLCEHTGRGAWLEDPAGFRLQPETNFMARAETGAATAGYVKTGEALDGADVWRKR